MITTAHANGSQVRAGMVLGTLRRPSLAGLILALAAFSGPAKDLVTESRGPFLHNIPLHDAQGRVISPPAAVEKLARPWAWCSGGMCRNGPRLSITRMFGWPRKAASANNQPGQRWPAQSPPDRSSSRFGSPLAFAVIIIYLRRTLHAAYLVFVDEFKIQESILSTFLLHSRPGIMP